MLLSKRSAFNPLDYSIALRLPVWLVPSGWVQHVPFAMALTQILQPRTFVELGTHHGLSYCAFCQAVKELGTDTRCVAVDTWKGDAHAGFYGEDVFSELKKHHDRLYGGFSELRRASFDAARDGFADASIDLLHIDGFHSCEAARHDFESWLTKMSDRGVVLMHDIAVKERDFGVWRFWEEVKSQYPSFEFFHGHGLGVAAVGTDMPPGLHALLDMSEEDRDRIRTFFYELGKRLEAESEIHALRRQGDRIRRQNDSLREEKDKFQQAARAAASLEAQLQAAMAERDAATAARDGALADLEVATAERDRLRIEVTEETTRRLDLEKRLKTDYLSLVSRIQQAVCSAVPAGAQLLVVTKGDESLLDFSGLNAAHFPQTADGAYSGYYPADSTSAIVQLESLRAKGAAYLVIPSPALWWLDHYRGFARHLELRYREVGDRAGDARIFSLREMLAGGDHNWKDALDEVVADFRARFDRDPAVLDWGTSLDLRSHLHSHAVFSVPPGDTKLPYLDHTVDVVAMCGDEAATAEARRVASAAVVRVTSREPEQRAEIDVEWQMNGRSAKPPTTSIIIPSYNGAAFTEALLGTLEETLPARFDGEIIVVDDASTDDTQERLRPIAERNPRLKVLRNRKNAGFIMTCNRGARAASGDIIIFFNNDTLALPGWLPPLWRIFRDYPDAGAAGGKLVFPDGRLQEAGGVVFSDGSAANFGRFDDHVEAPLYSYVREVDYVTGAFIATRRNLFVDSGGFDTRYRPIYYEETDYCFRLREQGYRIYYQPESVIVHLEGATCGTDPSQGLKRYQVVNRQKFIKKWKRALRHQPPPPGRFDLETWYALATRHASNGGPRP